MYDLFNLENANLDEIVTLNEANAILEIAKDAYPGLIDDVYMIPAVEDSYCFCQNQETGDRYICVDMIGDKSLRNAAPRILAYINEQFDCNFAMNLKTMTINAICHEIGHAIDFALKLKDNEYYYEEETWDEYDYFNLEAYSLGEEYDKIQDFLFDYQFEVNEDEFNEVLDSLNEYIDEKEKDLDFEYRMIKSEYAADKFSAEFMLQYLNHIPELFKIETKDNFERQAHLKEIGVQDYIKYM